MKNNQHYKTTIRLIWSENMKNNQYYKTTIRLTKENKDNFESYHKFSGVSLNFLINNLLDKFFIR